MAETAIRALIVMGLGLISAVAATASPISVTDQGCVTSLPTGSATWSSPGHFRFVVTWNDQAGCAATDDDAIGLNGIYDRVVEKDGSEWATAYQDRFPTCGRGQFDAQEVLADDSFGQLFAVVFNTGVDCADRRGGSTSAKSGGGSGGSSGSGPDSEGPPSNDPPWSDSPSPPPEDFPPPKFGPPDTPENLVPVPEPATWLLLGSGLYFARRRKRR